MIVVSITFTNRKTQAFHDVHSAWHEGGFFCLRIGNKLIRYNMNIIRFVEEFTNK